MRQGGCAGFYVLLRIGGSQEGDARYQRGMLFCVVGPSCLIAAPVFGRAVRVDGSGNAVISCGS